MQIPEVAGCNDGAVDVGRLGALQIGFFSSSGGRLEQIHNPYIRFIAQLLTTQ